MSEKNSYKRVQNEEAKPNSILNEPMPWRWFLHEKKLIIFSFAVYWCYFFMEYLFMNLKFSEEIKGLSDGFFGFKRVYFSEIIFFIE